MEENNQSKKNISNVTHFAWIDGVRIGRTSQEGNIELFGNVIGWGNFVVGRSSRDNLSAGGKKRLLQSEETQSLNKSTFNLTNIEGWIETFTQVHDNVRSQHLQQFQQF